MIRHLSFASSTYGLSYAGAVIDDNDVYLSYLPMAHIFEQAAQLAAIAAGGCVAFYQGNIRKVGNHAAMSLCSLSLCCAVSLCAVSLVNTHIDCAFYIVSSHSACVCASLVLGV